MGTSALRPVTDPAIWVGSELDQHPGWLFELTGEEIAGLRAMAGEIGAGLGGDLDQLMALPPERH